jgi:pyridoxamine 5'-phosphate oxidase
MTLDIPRPPNWGGFRLAVDAVELWVEGEYRIHDRARWSRQPAQAGDAASEGTAASAATTPWKVTRLQP